MKAVWVHIPVDSVATQGRHSLRVCSANQRTGRVSEWPRARGVLSSGPALSCGFRGWAAQAPAFQANLHLQSGLWVSVSWLTFLRKLGLPGPTLA